MPHATLLDIQNAQAVRATQDFGAGLHLHDQLLTQLSLATGAELAVNVAQRLARVARVDFVVYLKQLGNVPDQINDVLLWSELARAIFTYKEFIYVR